jgi:RimJ/RimL family protein N-acetyltransferase
MQLRRIAQRLTFYRQGFGPGGALGMLVTDALSKLGIRVFPYLILVEGPDGLPPPPLPQPDDSFVELGAADMEAVHALTGVPPTAQTMRQWLDEGRRCFGVKRQGKLIAFNWSEFEAAAIDSVTLFKLPPGTAYLYWMWTDSAVRGGGLAPFVRYRSYEALRAAGCHTLYSISVAFNQPSLRFKQKLHAKVVGRGFMLNLFNRWSKVFGWRPDR